MNKPTWDRLGSRYVNDEGNDLILFRTRYDRMRNPRNSRVAERLVLESGDWVNIVAVTPTGECVMVRQFRFGVGYDTLETPGGMVDPGENSLVAAQRELLEETGFGAGTWTYLGAVEPNPAFHDHLCHHWLATDVEKLAELDLGEGEHITVDLLTEAQVVASVRTGEVKHALALSVLSRVYALWPMPFTHEFHED